ncbi:MAG: PVC-type heme-binding CxxCH protein, partial [Planctomycetia bacterium]
MRLISQIISLLIGTHLFAQMILAQGFPASEAPGRMKVAEGFDVQLVASEPLVRQPVAMEFDDRGRLWVIQYLQYPNPAGLKRVQVDRYSRTKYDRIPEPPPRGPKGADRISILSDTNGDGIMDSSKDFIAGLNLASGMAFGHGGVFVLNVPYLLFYPDKNRDDVPDSDPDVLLTGFGMEDAHSVANSLTWGPDGWLYGCQGSTVTSNIRGIEFQQGVWRYHPISKKFELFCEGGGNSWGLDFDATGRMFYSTNYGGHVLLHGVQGAYYTKSFGKHGALHNPRAYGYFPHAPHKNFRGGHVTVGGIVYQGDSFPEKFQGKYIAGDLLGHGVYWHEIHPHGSTVQTSHGGELLLANDTWFGTTDVLMGPEGAVYVADWHDARKAHPDPDATWDRSNGRIFRIIAKGTKAAPIMDFQKLSNAE